MSVDLSPYLLDIEDQLWWPSCTAHAGTTALELLLNKHRGIKVEMDRNFLYSVILDRAEPNGLTKEIAKVLHEVGCAPVGYFDDLIYTIGSLFKSWKYKPSKRKFRAAAKYRISGYSEDANIEEALDEGFPVIVGLKIREAFHSCDWSDYSNSPMSPPAHVMVVVGYNQDAYLLVNSWGRSWGNNGLCWMPKALFDADCYQKWAIEL